MEKKSSSVAVLVLGICSIVFSGPLGLVSLILAIIGLAKAKKADLTDKKAKVGKVLSVIGLILAILSFVGGLVASIVLGSTGMLEEIIYEIEYMMY